MIISANDVKTKGVFLFGNLLEKFDELVINVRGKNKYIVLDIERYKEFRANELDVAYMKTMQDIKNGNYKTQTAKQHIKELMDKLKGKLQDYYNVSINMQYRVVIDFIIKDNEIISIDIGTHDEIY